jgi:hypothetical protein
MEGTETAEVLSSWNRREKEDSYSFLRWIKESYSRSENECYLLTNYKAIKFAPWVIGPHTASSIPGSNLSSKNKVCCRNDWPSPVLSFSLRFRDDQTLAGNNNTNTYLLCLNWSLLPVTSLPDRKYTDVLLVSTLPII